MEEMTDHKTYSMRRITDNYGYTVYWFRYFDTGRVILFYNEDGIIFDSKLTS